MTTAIDDATTVLEEAETLAEGAAPSGQDPVADATETPPVDGTSADLPDDFGPSDGDATPDLPSLIDEVDAAPSPPEVLDVLAETPDAPILDVAETAADVTPVDEGSDGPPNDLARSSLANPASWRSAR